MSFVSYFMLFQIINMPQVISLFLLLPNLVYFLWNAYGHILRFWGAVSFMYPAGIGLVLTVRIGIFELSWERPSNQHSRPEKCHPVAPLSEYKPQWDKMMAILCFFEVVDEHFFFWGTFYLGLMLDLWSCPDNTESFRTFLTECFLSFKCYVTIVHLSILTHQHCYSVIK